MRLLIQRVLEASISVSGKEPVRIGRGLMAFVGFCETDDINLVEKMACKMLKLRLWDEMQAKEDELKKLEEKEEEFKKEENNNKNEKKQARSWYSNLMENSYELLVVSNFTLYGTLKGNRPEFTSAMKLDEAKKLYDSFVQILNKEYTEKYVKSGCFQDYMYVSLVNDGPVTMMYEEENNEEKPKKGEGKKNKK